jgi:phospholipid/cholesterol/gamma-HCH transport system permease protein
MSFAIGLDILKLFVATIRQAFRPWRVKEIVDAIVHIGVESLPVITIATAFAGLVVTGEIAWHMDEALHTIQMVPGFTGQFILRELGIVIPALLLVSKVGASITAEVGTMKVTEQIDALKLLGINPVAYLVFPRWIACIVSLVCLTLIAIVITMSFAIGTAVFSYGFNLLEYINMLRPFVGQIDILCAVVKSMAFGSVIPIISCGYGFNCKAGAQGVGEATTNAVVTSTITVIVIDFALTIVFS